MSKLKAQTLFLLILFAVIAMLVLTPFMAMIIASFKQTQDLFRSGLNMSLKNVSLTLDNYKFVFFGEHLYFKWYLNSVMITLVQSTITLFLSACVAYGFSMYNFKFKNILFTFVLIMLMIPLEIIILPLYSLTVKLNLMDSHAGVIAPFIVSPFLIFFFKQYLSSIPKDFLEAARVDGCNEYVIFIKIFMPIMKPAFAAMGIFTAMNIWNSFLWPLITLSTSSKFTLPIGLASLLSPYGNNFKLLIAGSVAAIIPVLVIFILFRKSVTEAMTAGGIKG